MEATEVLEEETEVYDPVSSIEYVDEDSVVKVEDEERPLNYLNDTTEYEEWFNSTEEVDPITVTGVSDVSQTGTVDSPHWVIAGVVVLALALVACIVISVIRKRK